MNIEQVCRKKRKREREKTFKELWKRNSYIYETRLPQREILQLMLKHYYLKMKKEKKKEKEMPSTPV